MENILRKTSNFYFARCNTIHTSCRLNGWRQTGNAMKKVLGGTKKRKSYFEDSPKMPSAELFSKGTFEGKGSGNSRRATVLNKLFMRHITDQLATGKCAEKILGYGVEINRVKVTPDYKLLKVYWLAKGSQNDEVIDEILQRNSGLLRHELSQLRLMGVVPLIQFVKDKLYARIVELDSKLSIADFGEDHTPLNPAEKLKTEFEILSPLDDNIKKQLKELDETETEDFEELPLPPMPQNVLGLNHAIILSRIKKSVRKSEALHRIDTIKENEDESWVTFKLKQSTNEDPLQFGSEYSQREAFKDFLHKRQLLRLKARKENKNYIPDLEYIKEELRERHMENLSKFDIILENIEEDFIEDSEDVK
ncbi:uncharacterized protein LOC108908142 [Anoplophora glabripennis]|nr:uncharacterized protein LOC108908142 [Anoplophora glabripennis]